MKKLFILLTILFLTTPVFAQETETIFSPFTNTLDFILDIDNYTGAISTTGTVTGSVVCLEGGTYDTYFHAGTPTSTKYYQLPLTDGTNAQVLHTDGSGHLSWDADDGAGGGAPTDADYLVGTAHGSLSAEIVVGTAPGGELGNTWASPTIDDGITVANWTLTTPNIGVATATSVNASDTVTGVVVDTQNFENSSGDKILIRRDSLDLEGITEATATVTGIVVDTQYLEYSSGGAVTMRDDLTFPDANKLVYKFVKCAMIENLAAADDNMALGMFSKAVTITGVGCSYIGTGTTPATITLEDGSANAMTITGTNPTCVAHGTNATFAAVTAGNALVAGEVVRFDTTNAVSPETDEYTICIEYTE